MIGQLRRIKIKITLNNRRPLKAAGYTINIENPIAFINIELLRKYKGRENIKENTIFRHKQDGQNLFVRTINTTGRQEKQT